MKVVLVAVRYPPAPGGAETHVSELARGLAARGHEVVVHTSDLRTEYPFRRATMPDRDGNVKVVRHRARRLAGAWTVLPTLGRALMREPVDILHAHSYGYHHTVVAASVARRRKLPFVFTPHYHPPWSMEGGAARRALRGVFDPLLGQRVLDTAARTIFVSSGERDELARHMRVPARNETIPNGFHASAFDPRPDGAAFRAVHQIPVDAPLVVFAGRLASNKGLPVLVDAFAKLAPDSRLVLAGEDQGVGGTLREQARALGVLHRITFTGHLPAERYREALAAGDVFSLPSEWEAFGIVLAEAMACGVPCVATRVGGAPDVVLDGKTGYLVPYGDAGALAERLRALLVDPTLARALGTAGRERALREFSWRRVVERTEALYHEAMDPEITSSS